MPYNKFTDEQIIKALKCIEDEDEIPCAECAFANVETAFRCRKIVAKAAIDYITRQKSEIERLNHIRAELSREIDRLEEAYSIYEETTGLKQAKADAIREFAERLKRHSRKMQSSDFGGEFWDRAVLVKDIDNLVKEMTEGEA